MESDSLKDSNTVRFSIKKVHKAKHKNELNYNLLQSEHINVDGTEVEDTSLSLEYAPSTQTANADTAKVSKHKKINTKNNKWKACLNKVFLLMLACVIVSIVLLVWHFSHVMPDIQIRNGEKTMATFNVKSRILTVYNQAHPVTQFLLDSETNVVGDLMELQPCPGPQDNLCLKWVLKNSSISITTQQFGDSKDQSKLDCLKVEWKTSVGYAPVDCVNLTYSQNEMWFDTHQYIDQLSNSNYTDCVENCMQYIPGGASLVDPMGDVILNRGGSVIEPLWLSTSGVGIKASTHHNLYVCNQHCGKQSQLCFTSLPHHSHQELHHDSDGFHLDYMICTGESLPFVHRKIMENFLKPQKYGAISEPFEDLVNDGVFYEENLGDSVLASNLPLTATNNILVNLCKDLITKPLWEVVVNGDVLTSTEVKSQIIQDLQEIGGTIQLTNLKQLYSKLGDYNIANNTAMQTLHDSNFKTMLPVVPFVNYDTVNFDFGVKHYYLMTHGSEMIPSLTKLSIDDTVYYPGVIDLTNGNATQWFMKNIQDFLRTNKIDFMHMHYGQATWLPAHYNLSQPLHNPGHFSTLYADIAYLLDRCAITDVAYDSQSKNQFVLLSPAKGLRETLKSVLGAGLAGYPFVVPNFPCSLQKASLMMRRGVLLEGMVRWLQMVSFFPIMHLPWDSVTISKTKVNKSLLFEITQKYVELRNSKDVYPHLEKAMIEAEINRTSPVLTPMWMASDAINLVQNRTQLMEIFSIDDQFMVGSNLFVAPIFDMGVTSRDIYVPPGKWKDIVQNFHVETVTGKWIKNYNADLHQIPAFVKT